MTDDHFGSAVPANGHDDSTNRQWERPQSILAMALAVAADGWPVFPCGRNKKPCISTKAGGNGWKDASRDPVTIRRLFAADGAKLIGVPTGQASGVNILDLDPRHGSDEWRKANLPNLPETRIHQTMNGGEHWVFRHHAGVTNDQSGRIAAGVDVRGEGGYFIVPPSPGYHVISDAEVNDWPAWLLPTVLKPAKPPRPAAKPAQRSDQLDKRFNGFVRTLLDNVRTAAEGTKHSTLLNQARALGGIMDAAGISEADAVAWLMDALPDTVTDWRNARKTALDGLQHGRNNPIELEDRQRPGSNRAPPPQSEPEAAEAEPAPDPEDDLEAEIQRLAALSVVRYERLRQDAAKRLKVRAGFLDRMVSDARGTEDDTRQGRALELPMPDAWPQPVDGAALLFDLAEYFTRHAFLPHRASTALALWTVHTYAFELFEHTPRLHIRAIAKNSGKTTVLDLLQSVVCRPLATAHATSSALFRAIEMAKPSLLIDEADTFIREAEDIRGIINAGHKRGQQLLRTVGDAFEPRAFSVFAPVAIAGIGDLPGTIADRSIVIGMQRAMQHELPSPITKTSRADAAQFGRRAVRWILDHEDVLAEADPHMDPLFNRAADNWRALFAIADAAGDNWPDLARKAASELTVTDDATETTPVKLLSDIRAVFTAEWITSAELAAKLIELEGRPWAELGRTGKPLSANYLARLLRTFGIIPSKVGPKTERLNGYRLAWFADAFGRHLSPVVKA